MRALGWDADKAFAGLDFVFLRRCADRHNKNVRAPPSALTAQQAAWLEAIALLHGIVPGSPLTVTASARSAGAVTQTIAEVAGTVTVTTTAAPSGASGTSQLNTQETQWLENLARIYGLIDPLEVTATTRGDGTLSQTIAEVSGTTTVTKV